MSDNLQLAEQESINTLTLQSLGGDVDARAERIRNRRLFVTPKPVQAAAPIPAPPTITATEPEEDTNLDKIGAFEFRDGKCFAWLRALVTVASRGRRVGDVNRSRCVFAEVSADALCNSPAYRERIFSRAGLSNFEGMAIGGRNICYRGNGSDVADSASVQPQHEDHRGRGGVAVRGRGLGADSDDRSDEGNFPEAFEAGGALSKAWDAAIRAEARGSVFSTALEAATSGQVPDFEIFLVNALDENPDATIAEVREAYAKLVELIEQPETEDAEIESEVE
jgi:hypothetical protein